MGYIILESLESIEDKHKYHILPADFNFNKAPTMNEQIELDLLNGYDSVAIQKHKLRIEKIAELKSRIKDINHRIYILKTGTVFNLNTNKNSQYILFSLLFIAFPLRGIYLMTLWSVKTLRK